MRKRKVPRRGAPPPPFIKLRDGHIIVTLEQAAGLMTQRLPKERQLHPVWQKAAAMLMEAHATGKRLDLELPLS
jgi:hypothetical protein